MFRIFGAALLGAAVIAQGAPAHAQAWPQRPVTMIVSQAAGNSPDVLARIIAERLSRPLGQQIVVENRPGAANVLGTQAVARAAPDGYTFLFATSAALTANPYTVKALSYDPVRDFTPVAMVAKSTHVLLVNPSVTAKTLPELVSLEKAQPGKFSLAVDGPRNLSGIIGQYINKLAGTNFVLVPYNTITNAVQDTITGRVQVTIQSASVAEPFVKEGNLRPIAVAGAKRAASLPQVPTVAESLPGIELQGWFMVMAPTGTPADIVQKLNQEIDRILKEPDVQQRATALGFEIDPGGAGSPQSAGEFLRAELAQWGKVVRELGIEPQ
jgi:tripartite-type tricarboxylate transporter receptor subunit TctC